MALVKKTAFQKHEDRIAREDARMPAPVRNVLSPSPGPRSTDPRQTDLEKYIVERSGAPAANVAVVRVGEPLGTAVLGVAVEASRPIPGTAFHEVRVAVGRSARPPGAEYCPTCGAGEDPEDAVARLRALGVVVSASWFLGSPALARLGWHLPDGRSFQGFFGTAREGLAHVCEYARLLAFDPDGAALFHARSRCRTEAEAIAELDERAGTRRPDPNRADPRFANDHAHHNKKR